MSNHAEVHGSGKDSVRVEANQSCLLTVAAGLSLLIPAAVGFLHSKVPTILYPFPALTVLPALALSSLELWAVAALVPPLLFFAWNPGLLRGMGKIPKRSNWLLIAMIVFSAFWFIIGWHDGIHYQGATYVHAVAIVNVAWVALLAVAFTRYGRYESFVVGVALHWALFLWLAWYALPYLGELP